VEVVSRFFEMLYSFKVRYIHERIKFVGFLREGNHLK